MAADSFVHLHVHSEYSMLDGAARVGELIQAAKGEGMPAVGVTDHGNVFGAYDFWKQATDAGIKPIIGTEAYITPGTHRRDKTRVRWGGGGGDDVSGSGAYTHMTLLSETTEGMHNLFRLSSLASIEGYYIKPRMDRAVVAEEMPAIAVTDHGNMFGAYDFWKQATEAGIKPIIGTEAYITPGHAPRRQDARALGQRAAATTCRARVRTRT